MVHHPAKADQSCAILPLTATQHLNVLVAVSAGEKSTAI